MKRGFTLLEILIAISIILLLVGLAVLGMRSSIEATKKADTQGRLKALNALLSEATVKGCPAVGQWYDGGSRGIWSADRRAFWFVHRSTTTGPDFYAFPVVMPTGPLSDTSDVMRNTAIAFRALAKTDVGNHVLGSMDNKDLAMYPVVVDVAGGGTTTVQVPVILDAWGHPILFCPGSGVFTGAAAPGNGDPVHTALGSVPFESAANSWPTSGMAPFFFSAGPDGDPATWEDNITSAMQ